MTHLLGVGLVPKVRVPWLRVRRIGTLLEFEPAFTKFVLVDVKCETAFFRTESPDSACSGYITATLHIRSTRPPLLASRARLATHVVVRHTCAAARRRICEVEPWLAQTPHDSAVARISGVSSSVAPRVKCIRSRSAAQRFHRCRGRLKGCTYRRQACSSGVVKGVQACQRFPAPSPSIAE
jgi:hypothetical protein